MRPSLMWRRIVDGSIPSIVETSSMTVRAGIPFALPSFTAADTTFMFSIQARLVVPTFSFGTFPFDTGVRKEPAGRAATHFLYALPNAWDVMPSCSAAFTPDS